MAQFNQHIAQPMTPSPISGSLYAFVPPGQGDILFVDDVIEYDNACPYCDRNRSQSI